MGNEKSSGEIDRHLVARIVSASTELAVARDRKFEFISLQRKLSRLALSVSAQMVRSKVRYSDAPPSIATSAPVM